MVRTGHPAAHEDHEGGPPGDLIARINEAARDAHPLPLLQLASAMLSSMDTRTATPFGKPEPDVPDRARFIKALQGAGLPETALLLAAFCSLIDDELERARIRRNLLSNHADAADMLERFAGVTIGRAVEMTHVLGDGDNLFLGALTAAGDQFTVSLYIDHNLGTLVKDTFAVPEPIDSVLALVRENADDGDYQLTDIDLADARARAEEAIELGAITYPPLESDTWPAVRPLVNALLHSAPAGGTGYQRPEYSEEQLAELSDDFFGSDHGRALDNQDHRSLLESILWFGTDYGPGDPLRWSQTASEILLLDWIPRKIVAPADELRAIPVLLRSFVRYSHAQRGIRPGLTEETLTAIDEMEPEYVRAISSKRRQGPEALLESIGALPPLEDETFSAGGDPQAARQRRLRELQDLEASSIEEIMLNSISSKVGGEEEMDRLNDRPLPDEDFDWNPVPADIHERVREVLDLCDRCCAELLDVGPGRDESAAPEHRTAARRLLTRVAVGDPEIFRRKGAANTAAAAVCWIIAKANGKLQGHTGGLSAKELAAHFSVKGSVSQRAGVMLRAAGINDDQYGAMDLGTPDLLTSAARRELIEMRDKYRAALQES